MSQRKEISGSFITFNIFIPADNIFHVNPVGKKTPKVFKQLKDRTVLKIFLPCQSCWEEDSQSLQTTQRQDSTQNISSLNKHYRSEERRVGKECRSRWS